MTNTSKHNILIIIEYNILKYDKKQYDTHIRIQRRRVI
jgi:hypothetical protein